MPRLPRTPGSRPATAHLRLLTGVDIYAPPGLQFSGQILRPGGEFDIEELPRPAVILECAGSARVANAQSRYSFEHLRILWWFDFGAGEWREACRSLSSDSAWTVDFAHAAARLLYAAPVPLALDRVRPVVERLLVLIDEDLSEISSEERCAALAAIETHIANRIVYASARMPVGSEWAQRLAATG